MDNFPYHKERINESVLDEIELGNLFELRLRVEYISINFIRVRNNFEKEYKFSESNTIQDSIDVLVYNLKLINTVIEHKEFDIFKTINNEIICLN